MTTTISLAARDFIVVGCDSLATTSIPLVWPGQIASDFFDDKGLLKAGPDGEPLLKNSDQIWARARSMPVDQLPSVTKLFDLAPFKACLLFAGTSRIGETTIRNAVETFLSKRRTKTFNNNYTVEQIANKLKTFVLEIYAKEYPNESERPLMEIILSGYSANHYEPEIWKLTFSYDTKAGGFSCNIINPVKRKDHNVIFGGQYDVIQRAVKGIDESSYWSLRAESMKILEEYHVEIEDIAKQRDPSFSLPKPDFSQAKYNLFENNLGGVTQVFSDVGSLSEQAGIDFVHFLVSIMIKSQEFSSSLPTVGGNIHVAMLTKNASFRWISRETSASKTNRYQNSTMLEIEKLQRRFPSESLRNIQDQYNRDTSRKGVSRNIAVNPPARPNEGDLFTRASRAKKHKK